jgi:uncharacterized protein (DUF736 family)
MKIVAPKPNPKIRSLALLAMMATGLNLVGATAADAMPNIQVNPDGSVQIDRNAFDLETGDLENGSNIPLPNGLIRNSEEGMAQPVLRDRLAPNAVNVNVDVDNINQQIGNEAPDFTIQHESLQVTTQFDLRHRQSNHAFGEGIQVTVFGPDGEVKVQERAFVRGDEVTLGPDGNSLPANASINIIYGAEDTVELRVLNLRDDRAQPTDSGIYFTSEGQFAVEDLPNGGDLDFTDGDYFELTNGNGEADIEKAGEAITETISFRTEVVETPLAPEFREEQVVETETVQLQRDIEETTEERDYGQVESADPDANILPHALGVRTEDDEQLVYSRYSDAAQIRLGSDGGSITGQFAPLVENPAVPPTLINGTLRFEPWANDNQAGLSGTIGLTQFLHPTHRDAVDLYGNAIAPADGAGPRLLQPTGLVHNTRWVGYVPAVAAQVLPGKQLASTNGVIEIPADTAVRIAPPEPDQVGRGDAAYTHSVGGLIIEDYDGGLTFVPQWTYDGYANDDIFLAAGQARRIIYALVPQQQGQALQLGQRYALNSTQDGYLVAESDLSPITAAPKDSAPDYGLSTGGFQVISADQHPENFHQESLQVYAVEDTVDGQNAITGNFNGIPGIYRHGPDAEPEYTVDVTQPAGVDARVGNLVSTPDQLIPAVPGQSGYATTTLAGGLYARGGLSLGLGNQEDTITTSTLTFESQADVNVTRVTTQLFATPRLQVDTTTTQLTTRFTDQTRQEGTARFDINDNGLLQDIQIDLAPEQIVSRSEEIVEGPRETTTEILLGAEYLADTATATAQSDAVFGEFTLADQQVDITTDSYPNFSPLLGELALGGILNFGNTPWTPAANTIRAELFVRGTVLGQRDGGSNLGWRTELVFNPFGEQQRPAFSYDESGAVTPIYQTEPVLDAAGQPVYELIETVNGDTIQVATNQFIRDEAGELLQASVGTGVSRGPGIYLRLEDLIDDNTSLAVIGGIKFDL